MKSLPIKSRHVLIGIGLIVLVVIVVQFNQRILEMNRLTAQLEEVRVEGTAVMQTQQALRTQVVYATSDQALEDWAVEVHWGLPGNEAVVLIPGQGESAQSTPQVQEAVPTECWEVWWALFFDQ